MTLPLKPRCEVWLYNIFYFCYMEAGSQHPSECELSVLEVVLWIELWFSKVFGKFLRRPIK